MAARIDPKKKQQVIKLYYEGAKVGHIAICTRLKTTTVQDLIQRERKKQRDIQRETRGNQDERPTQEEIEAAKREIQSKWTPEQEMRARSSAYRVQRWRG